MATSNWWTNESAVTLGAAAKRYPISTHPSTVFRHATRPNRYGVRLESFVSGGRRMTTVEAIDRYHARCTEAANGIKPSAVGISDRAAAAEAELAAMMGVTR